MASQDDSHAGLMEPRGILRREIPVHHPLERNVARRLGAADIRRLRKIQGNHDGPSGRLHRVEPPIFIAGSTDHNVQIEFPRETVRSQKVEFIGCVDHQFSCAADFLPQCFQGIVAFGPRLPTVGIVRVPRSLMPVGVVHGLPGQGHRAHGRIWELQTTPPW